MADDIFASIMREASPHIPTIENAMAEQREIERQYAFVAGEKEAWREMALRAGGLWNDDDEIADDD